MQAKIVTPESLESVLALLKECKLPYSDVRLENNLIIAYYDEHQTLVGSGALEFYGDYTLLRSVAVVSSQRGREIGQAIVRDLILRSKARAFKKVYLLTETAHDFFLRFGFMDVDRKMVPFEVQRSSEFSSVCPQSAACMALDISSASY